MMAAGPSSNKGKWKKVKVPVTKHDIILLKVPPEVEAKGSLLGYVENFKNEDHDVQDLKKIPEFTVEKYMQHMPKLGGITVYEVKEWV